MEPCLSYILSLRGILAKFFKKWARVCVFYTSRPLLGIYNLWKTLLRRMLSRSHPAPLYDPELEKRSGGQSEVMPSELPRGVIQMDDQRGRSLPAVGVQPDRPRPCLRTSSTLSGRPLTRNPKGTTFSDQDIVLSPTQDPGTSCEDHNERLVTTPTEFDSQENLKLVPFCPDDSTRYDRHIDVPTHPNSSMSLTIKSLQKPCEPTLSGHDPSWRAHAQPEGQLYFTKLSDIIMTSGRQMRIYTEAYMHDQATCEKLNHFVRLLEESVDSMTEHTYLEAVLEIPLQDSGEVGCYYYLVDAENRTIGWFQDYDGTAFADHLDGLPSVNYLHHFFEKQYWVHVERFPHYQQLGKDVFEELACMTLYSAVDTSTSTDSTSASLYSASELQQLCAFTKNLQSAKVDAQPVCDDHCGAAMAYMISSAGRLHSVFAHNRFYHLCGHHGARLVYDQSIRGRKSKQRTWLIKIISPLLFQASYRRLSDLEKLFTDKTVSKVPWKTFIESMMRDWEQFVINAAVLLNANVAFMVLPAASHPQVGNSQQTPNMSIAQIASQLSMVASIGSMIVGLLLVRQHRTRPIDTAKDAAVYLTSHSEGFGLEFLAIEYSLPYALLMWGMVTFLLAIGFVCFGPYGFEVTVTEYVILISAWIVVGVFILWTVVINLESTTSYRISGIHGLVKRGLWKKLWGSNGEVGNNESQAMPRRRWTISRRRAGTDNALVHGLTA